MNPFSEDLMEDIMCLTSFSSYHNDEDAEYEMAKPLYHCWGRRQFLLPLEDIGLPAVALRQSLEPDRTSLQERKAFTHTVEPMYGKGRARILKDHSLVDGSNRENVLYPVLDTDDIDPHQFDYEFDPTIQAEIVGTAHHVDVVPSAISDKCSTEPILSSSHQLADCDIDIVGTVDTRMRKYAHRLRSVGSHSQISGDVLNKFEDIANKNSVEKNSSVSAWLNNSGESEPCVNLTEEMSLPCKSHVATPCSLSVNSNNGSQVSVSPLPHATVLSQVTSDLANVRTALDNVNAQQSPTCNNDSQKIVNSQDSHLCENVTDDDDDDDAIWERLRRMKEQKKQEQSTNSTKESNNKSKCFIPAGAERFQESWTVVHNVDDEVSSSDDELESDDIRWNGKRIGEIPMYFGTEQPKSTRVTLGDYFANNDKLKTPVSEKNYQCVKPTPAEPELGQEYFPELSSQSACCKETIAIEDDPLPFNMKDLAATLLDRKQNAIQPIDESGDSCDGVHNDIPEGTLLEIDGLPSDVSARELKNYLEDFGEISRLDFCRNNTSCTKTARLYMKDASSCDWIISCLNGESSPIGDDTCILTVKLVA